MGIIIEASINCDLAPEGKQCYTCREFETVDECQIEEIARNSGWVYLPESASWACPKCSKFYGGYEAIRKRDFEGTL